MRSRRPMSSILSYARTVLALAVCAAMNLALAAPAQVRYVSSDGDDGNDGLSESTPWRTLRKLSEGLPAGGTGLLRRGDVFYGQLKVPAGPSPDSPTTIDAYGTGPAPEVCGYKIPKRDASVWKQVGDKLWQIDLSDHSRFDGNHETDNGNVGFLLVDGRFFGRKSSYKKKQTPSEQWGFVDDYKCLTVWSEENPAAAAKDIRIAVKMHLAIPGSNTEVRNVVFRGTGSHGLNSTDPSHLRVSGCSFLELGGSYLEPKPEWGGTRYGNGVQIWRGGSDVVVTNCVFADIYDVAFTMQGPNPIRSWEDVSVVDCVMNRCTQSYELWASKCGPGIGLKGCTFVRNRCVDTGRGWAYDVRPDKANATPLLMYAMETPVCDVLVKDNVFVNSRGALVFKSRGISELPESYRIVGNTIVGPPESPVANRQRGAQSAEENKRVAAIRAANTFRDVAVQKEIEVVCVYYPHWHRYPKGDEWFGAENWKEGEWTFVKTAKPRFPGHRQPLVPSTGYLDGADPKDVEKEIALASDAGIDVFLYDYYWYDGKVTQEESLEKGFLGAANRDRMKFALMWCYHERRDQFRPKLGEPRRVLMSLAHTKEEFLGLIRYSAEHYFNKPEYWRKDGRLFFSIYDAPYFCSKRGNDAGRIKAELDEARGIVRAAGLGELHFNAQGAGPKLADFMADCGFDSLTDYNTSPYHMPDEMTSAMRAKGVWEIDYRSSFPTVRRRWQEMSAKRLPYIPNVTTGWDSTPRCRLDEPYPWKALDYPYTMSFTNNTPEAFREILSEAKAHAENDPKKPGAVYINGWNEYTEGTYLLPNNFDADGALRAINAVFGRGSAEK